MTVGNHLLISSHSIKNKIYQAEYRSLFLGTLKMNLFFKYSVSKLSYIMTTVFLASLCLQWGNENILFLTQLNGDDVAKFTDV